MKEDKMSEKNGPIELKLLDPLQDAAAIKRCLEYLRIEAGRTGLHFAAHLIGVAAEAVSDSIALSEKSLAKVDRDGTARFSPASISEITRRH
ncbi:hypothetical protein AAFN88_09350 [Pelagibius sp. CAU 1746]|uniref:hypothetical protein n=1 Tax=Pelagibius sp. CAU 1746 TaxID=3140370 RepID=UPI00325C1DE6